MARSPAYAALAVLMAFMPWSVPAAAGGDDGAPTRLGGQDLTCTDFRGRAVRTYQVAGLGDAGRSEIFYRVPVIKLDPDVLATLSDRLQIFFFLHECGHHKLGHLVNGAEEAETEADCWAIKTGRDGNYFNRADVADFRDRLSQSRGSRAGHLPGLERHAQLLSCFDQD